MPQTIQLETPFDVVFLKFWEPGDIPDHNISFKILTYLHFLTGFGIGAAISPKKITPDQAIRWDFVNLFVLFGFPKMIVVDADGIFLECLGIISKIPH